MHWVETAAACLAATSSFLMAFFLSAFEAAAFVTALRVLVEWEEGGWRREERRGRDGERKEGGREGGMERWIGREGGGRERKEGGREE